MASAFHYTAHAPPLSHVKHELHSDSMPKQQQSPPSLLAPQSQVKPEPTELPIVALNQHGQQRDGEQEPKEAQFLKSIDQLCNLSADINEFYRRYDELQKHLDFIQSAIDARFKEHQQPQQIQSVPATASPPISNVTGKQASTEAANTKKEIAATAPATSSAPPKSELMSLCEMMCGRSLRKYVTSHLSSVQELRAEVPCALKCAPKPAKLVLDCIGRFYLQGSRAYTKNSPMIPGRKASILILEFFMLMINDDIEFDSAVKQEAEEAAVSWRKRLIAEGGMGKATEIDARGLLLFVGCYGIPKLFTNDDIWDLVRSSNSKQIADALRRSRVLVKRISDILERMMNNGMKIEAIDIASTFGIEDKFPPQKILNSYLRDSKEASKRRKRVANNSPVLLKEASEKQLAALKSVMKFLEDHNLDPVKLIPGWQLREKIDTLEKDIIDLNKKIDDRVTPKRKADENEFSNNLKNQEIKRLRCTGSPLVSSSHGLYEQRGLSHVDSNGIYNASRRLNLLDGGFSGHINNPAVVSMVHGSSSFSDAYGVASTSSFAGSRMEMLVDRTGQTMGSTGLSYGWHGVGDASFINGSGGQSFVHQPASGLFGSTIEGFAGLPKSPPTGAANRSSTSDLYRFADAVM